MELDLTPDQQLFVETTRKFLESEMPIPAVRALHEAGGGFEADYWRQGAELGWTAALVPEELGGGSVSTNALADLALVSEEMGRQVSPGPLLAVNVVADALARSGTAEQQNDVLPALIAGETIATWAFDDGDGSWDARSITTTARQDGGEWVIDGTKSFVPDADAADWFLVVAATDGGLTQFLVPKDTAGLTVEPLGSLDLVRHFGELKFEGARVPASAVVGTAGSAADDVERALQVALCIQNADTNGCIARVFEFTVEYANDRIAFGRPIGSYQALKHRFADMKAWLEACHATSNAATAAVSAGDANATELVSVAKAYIADRAPQIVQDCVQLHGGIGVTWEHDLHLYLRRVTQNSALYGSASQHRERIASLIGM